MKSGIALDPGQLRRLCRQNHFSGATAGMAPGFIQANLVILPADWADSFRRFCQLNSKPCPLLEVVSAGSPRTMILAQDADLRTDLPRYRVFRHGDLIDEPPSIETYWREDFVSFLLGCSFSFDEALQAAGIEVRHVVESKNVPMYCTNVICKPVGAFESPLVVSMRPLSPDQVNSAITITHNFPLAHGAPVHIGDPESIGIDDLSRPDYGDSVTIKPGEVPVFWACGVTPQVAIAAARPPIAITHCPGSMFVSDLHYADLVVTPPPAQGA